MKIKLIADSSCSVPKDIAEKHDIEIVPLGIIFGKEEFKDGVTISDEEFFKRQEFGDVPPTTSQVNQYEWEECFKKFLGEYDHLVVMTLSSKMSGTHQSAKNAIHALGADNIHLFDTESVSVCSGICVWAVARYMETCNDIEKIKKMAQHYINRVDVYATFDSLRYLKAGGRLSTASAFIGTMLKVKLILTSKDGIVYPFEKIVSTKKTLKRIKELTAELHDPTMPMLFGEGAHMEKAMELARDYQETFGVSDFAIAPIGATVGVHTGPRSVGVAFFCKEEIRNVKKP